MRQKHLTPTRLYTETYLLNILKKLKEGQINLENATTNILDVENVNMLGIDENNVDEVIMGNVNITENA